MKLPTISVNLPFKQKKIPSAYYLTLTIGKEKADAVVFEESLKRAKVVGHGRQYFNQNITTLDDESLLNFLDKAISTAEKNLPENIETHETIFGVDPAWVESGKIKKDYLLKLKKISEDLDLKPIGFIVTTEAIAHLIQKEEGAPVSAILTEIGKKYITATLLRGGRVIESSAAEIGESAPETLDRVLKSFSTPEVLPSRIILFGENTTNLNQEFTSFSWSKTLPFLHLPQITPLEKSIDSKAVLYGAASQMSFVITDISGLTNTGEEISDLAEVDIDKAISNPQENNDKEPAEEIFGFVEGEDVSKNTSQTPPVNEPTETPTFKEEISEIPEGLQIKNSQSQGLPANALLIFAGLKNAIPKLKKYIKLPANLKLPIGGAANKQLKLFLLPGIIVFIFLLFIFYFLLFRSAIITLSVDQKSVNKTTDVTFSPTSPTDPSSETIKANLISVPEDSKLSTPATGKKQTGDKAKGTVTIFNNNDSPQTLSSGTVIISSNNLNFTLDQSVTIASQSGDEFSGTKPGTTNVTVTASNFGTDSNLPSDTKFTIAGTDSIVAKNDNPFSGGTTKNITVVSADDLSKLTSETISNLQSKAQQDTQGKITSSEILLPNFVSTNFDVKNFNQNVGDQVSSVSLTATVDFQSIVYSKDDLNTLAQSIFQQELGNNLEVSKNDTSASAKNIKQQKNGDVSASLTIDTKIIPEIDGDSTAKSVAGKSFGDATTSLSKIPQVENVSIKFSPNIFFFPKLLPASPKNIKIVVNSNG